MVEKRRAFEVMVGNPEGNRPLRKPRRRVEECIIRQTMLV
jgi:hypothetical protein